MWCFVVRGNKCLGGGGGGKPDVHAHKHTMYQVL